MKERITGFILKNEVKIKNTLYVAASCTAMFANNYVMADADAAGLMETIIKILASLVTVLAVILAAVGLIHYAQAYSEGDGPAKQKAIGQIAAAGMLIALALILQSKAGELVKFISTDI